MGAWEAGWGRCVDWSECEPDCFLRWDLCLIVSEERITGQMCAADDTAADVAVECHSDAVFTPPRTAE